MTKKPRPRYTNIVLLVAIAGLLFFVFRTNLSNQSPGLRYSEVVGLFEEAEVSSFTLDLGNGNLEYTLRESGEVEKYKMPYMSLFVDSLPEYLEIYEEAHDGEKLEYYDFKYSGDNTMWFYIVPAVLLMLVLGAFVYYVMFMQNDGGSKGAMNVGKAKVKNQAENKKKNTFKDVAGADEEKEELEEIVEFLKNPKRFNALGARIPHGVLLVGPPGTGKTLLARACAGEAGVPFYSISGSDFVEMYVGVGASRVRDLFDKAKKTAPCIVFIDEIDAVGRQRGAGLGGGHDEREQTLNQLLVEMDGFDGNEGVIVVAATNRADILDKALLRPGRFDRQVYVGLPDVKGREEILLVHTRKKPLGPDVDLRIIARTTPGFTGADLENLVNEAALLAARHGRKVITEQDFEEANIKVMAGPEKRSRVVTEKERRLTAFHEAGHAITAYYCPTSDPVHQITIIPHGPAGGFTMYRPEEDVQFRTKTQMQENIVQMLGGRVAEKLVLDDISTGASNDLERATKIARAMVTRYGFSERLGPVVYDNDPGETFLGRDYGHTRNYGEEVAGEIDTEMRALLDGAYNRATEILESHMDQLHLVANTLLEREKLAGDEFRVLMEGGTLPPFEIPPAPKAVLQRQEAALTGQDIDPEGSMPAAGSGTPHEVPPDAPAAPKPAPPPATAPDGEEAESMDSDLGMD
ncbi:ATP-dependent zinc metalloprotease FtsH [Ruminococcaceae bacterium OttesenSCG-928-O06]|nr:ATP-dependent zinc metalloprotease FtsH [Ruminococcaceae bacterium OttesenSCG-928-O06]